MLELKDSEARSGEYIPAGDMRPIVLQPHPLHPEVKTCVRGGQTLQAMLEECARDALPAEQRYPGAPVTLRADIIVTINGYDVPRHLWPHLRPKPGTQIKAVINPLAGGSSIARTVLSIAVVAAATFATGGFAGTYFGASAFAAGSLGAAALGAAVMIGGTLLANALVPTKTASNGGSTSSSKSWNQLTGTSNSANPWGVIPMVIGESRYFPPHAAKPYTEYVGESAYQHGMLDLGFLNPGYSVQDIRIGTTDIADYDDVQYEIATDDAITLFRNDNDETLVNAQLEDGTPDAAHMSIDSTTATPGDWITRTSAANAETIVVNLVLSTGLQAIAKDGKKYSCAIGFDIECSPQGADTWTSVTVASPTLSGVTTTAGGHFVVTGNTTDPYSIGVSWTVAKGQYDVRVRRRWRTFYSDSQTFLDSLYFQTMTSSRQVKPSTTGTVKFAYRIKATDQLNGTLDNLSLLVKNTYRPYDIETGAWGDYTQTCNTAWVVLDLLSASQGVRANISDSKLDFVNWSEFADWCDLYGFETRETCDSAGTLLDLCNKILANSLASMDYVNGKYSVVWDRNLTESSASLMPTECTNMQVTRVFTRIPHALRVTFLNIGNSDWASDEIIVLRDGYSLDGKDARGNDSTDPEPTEYETYDLEMAMPAQQAWKIGRFHFAQALYRANTYTWDTDIAGLGILRGNLIDVTSDVAAMDAGAGRIRSLVAGGYNGAAATLKLDSEMELSAGQQYRVRIRNPDGSRQVIDCTPHSIYTDTFYLASYPTNPDLGFGDAVAVFAVEQQSQGVIISQRQVKTSNLNVSFAAVNNDSRVFGYWQDAPEDIVSDVTGNTFTTPSVPVIISAISSTDNDSTDDAGVRRATLRLNVRQPSESTAIAKPATYEIRYRLHVTADDNIDEATTTAWQTLRESAANTLEIANVIRGRTYDFQVKAVSAAGMASDWTAAYMITIPDTNQVGALALPSNVAGYAGVWDVDMAVTYSASTSSATISASAGTYTINGQTISYDASSVAVSGAAGATDVYYLYYNDPTWAGGTQTLYATDDYAVAYGDAGNLVIIDQSVTFPTSGTSTGGGSTGGGVHCPWIEAWVIECERGPIHAGAVRVGDWLAAPAGTWVQVTHSERETVPCVAITSEQGHTLTCSGTAPILTAEGEFIVAQRLAGQRVDIAGAGIQRIAHVLDVGMREVQHISCAGEWSERVFLAGNDEKYLFPHHNRKADQPPI